MSASTEPALGRRAPRHRIAEGPAGRQEVVAAAQRRQAVDYDRYAGRYGIADIREAHHSRIHTYALAIDVQAKLYLPQMFGSGSFRILPCLPHLVR